MTLKKLELQNIDGLTVEKRNDENRGIISLHGELVEVRYERGNYEFRQNITDVKDVDMNLITKLSKCLKLASGGLQMVHSRLLLEEDRLFSVMNIENDQIVSVKSHERLNNFVYEAVCYRDVFDSHSV